MRALWLAAPLALTRYVGVLVAVVIASALAAGAAASNPFVRAGVKSASLRSEVRTMSPYAAGLSIVSTFNPVGSDLARRAEAIRFGRTIPGSGPPVLTTTFGANVQTPVTTGLQVYLMARTNAVAHIDHLSGGGDGAWISIITAKDANLHAGDTLSLSLPAFGSTKPPVARVRVAGVYQALEDSLDDPYWATLTGEIRPPNPDVPEPEIFVIVPERTLLRIARELGVPDVDNEFDYPVSTTSLTYVGASRLQESFTQIIRELPHTGRALGCGRILIYNRPSCVTSTSLDATLLLASADVSALSATIWLLSACALGIALLVAAAAGVFLVRRRSDEAYFLFARGERTLWFALRTGLEALLPAALGGAIGLGAAVLALDAFTPAGTLDSTTTWIGVRDAAVAAAVTVVLIAITAAASFPRRADAGHPLLRRIARVPWEVVVLAGAAAVLGLLLSGGGLVRTANGDVHPSLEVFLLPALAAAGVAGLVARLARRAVRARGSGAPMPVFLALRRVAAARSLLIAVIVAAATALAVFAYATTLSASVSRAIAEKAFVSNGSDVQGVVDPTERIYDHFPFPAAIVEIDSRNAFTPDGEAVDIVAGDPARLADVIRWGPWGDDPRPLLQRLQRAAPRGTLPAIASPNLPHVDAIVDQGARIPIRIVGRAPFPGMSGGHAAVLVSRATLRRVAAAHHILDPGELADGVIWAKGNPRQIEHALLVSNIKPTFFTTYAHVRADPSVRAGRRSYGYLRAIGGGAVVLALLALVLYLQARQRGQIVASALVRRMGAPGRVDTGAVALEAAALAVLAFLVGVAVAVAMARAVTPHVDPLPQYAPGTSLSVPWTELAIVGGVTAAVAALLAATAVALALRSDASEALRVA